MLAGAPILEQGMVESDFAELAAAGVGLLGKVGLGSVKAGHEARQMVAWARKHGIQSTIHTGGPSIPGSGLIDKDVVPEADADVIGHINGGHTSLPAVAVGRDADFVFMDRAQNTAGRTLLESIQLVDLPGIGMVMIDGLVRCGRSRNKPPAQAVPVVMGW